MEARLGEAIFGDGAACADDDLVNVDEVMAVVGEGGSSSSSTNGIDNDDNMCSNSSSVHPLPFRSVLKPSPERPSPPLLLGEDQ